MKSTFPLAKFISLSQHNLSRVDVFKSRSFPSHIHHSFVVFYFYFKILFRKSDKLFFLFWDHDENRKMYQGTMLNSIFKAHRVSCKFWGFPWSYIQDTRRDIIWRCLGVIPSFLQMLKNNSTQKLSVFQRVYFGLKLIHIHRFAYQLCKDQNRQNLEKEDCWEGLVWFLRWNPDLTVRKAKNINYGRLMKFTRFLKNFVANKGLCEAEEMTSFIIQRRRDRIWTDLQVW